MQLSSKSPSFHNVLRKHQANYTDTAICSRQCSFVYL